MPTNTSHDLYLNSLRSRHTELRNSVATMLSILVEDSADKESAIQATHAKAQELCNLLAQTDVPSWLTSIINILKQSRPNYSKTRLINDLIPILEPLGTYSWHDISDEPEGIDFDEIYYRHKQQGNTEDLFDKIIIQLQKIIDSGEVDSVKTINALEKLISTLKRSKAGSYTSMMAGWGFLQALMKNWIFEQLKSIPVLGPILSALSETISEMESEIVTLHSAIHDEIKQRYSTDIPTLSYDRYAQISSNRPTLTDTQA